MRQSLIDHLSANWRAAENWTPGVKQIVATQAVDALVEWLRNNWEAIEDEHDVMRDGPTFTEGGEPQHDLLFLADLLEAP